MRRNEEYVSQQVWDNTVCPISVKGLKLLSLIYCANLPRHYSCECQSQRHQWKGRHILMLPSCVRRRTHVFQTYRNKHLSLPELASALRSLKVRRMRPVGKKGNPKRRWITRLTIRSLLYSDWRPIFWTLRQTTWHQGKNNHAV